jgi:ribosomal protein L29
MGRRSSRRETEIFSISFLDCITCGLGSVVLLLVLSDVRSPAVEQSQEDLKQQLVKLEDELVDITGQTDVINRDLKTRQEQLSEVKERIARLQGDLSNVRGKYAASKKDADVQNEIEGKLVSARQTLTEEMKRLLGEGFQRKSDDTIGGIPVDSEYIIFVIDTSGSMVNYGWLMMIDKMQETLNIYPKVKGFQVMSDQGYYLFPGFRGKWIPDTPAQRKTVIDNIRTWNAFSASSPASGACASTRSAFQCGRMRRNTPASVLPP